MTDAATFDAAAYKTTTRAQWDLAAEAWHTWGPTLESWLGGATERMLDAAGAGPGAAVLDVAAGAGGQTIAAARRVGPNGRVLATDLSAGILDYTAQEARKQGLVNVDVRQLDAEHLDVAPGTFDSVISRLGFMYFPDHHAAFSGMLRALRPGGRLSGVVWSTPEANRFFSFPVSLIRTRAQLPPPAPGQPGPFSFGTPGIAEQALAQAGFVDATAEPVDAPVRLPSAAECVRFERESFGALHQMMAGLDEEARESVWAEIADELAQLEGPDGFVAPCELLVVSARRPL